MNRTKTPKRDLHGIVLLNKSAGMTSNRALQTLRRHWNARKAGHTGALDPLATGMLPICFGDATRFSQVLLDAAKVYEVTATLGEQRLTGDGEGEVIARAQIPELSLTDWQTIANKFVGSIDQIPPAHSALKVNGRRMYKLARAGKEFERQPRRIQIYALTVGAVTATTLTFRVRCSKGTYIRALVEDIAAAAQTLAWTSGLHRTGVEPFDGDMLDLEELIEVSPEAVLQSPDCALVAWDSVVLSAPQALDFCTGRPLQSDAVGSKPRRYYSDSGLFLGVAESGVDGEVQSRRVMSAARATLEAHHS
ncbi:MAG: tRNA pseudouridine(55) synthase TruB [Pseudomonadota bacterium]